MWYRLADRLHQPVQYLQRMTSSKEFTRWKYYLKEAPNFFDPIHYYLANIVWTLIKANSKDGKVDVSLEDCLIKFGPVKDEKKLTPEERVQRSKDSWAQLLGVAPRGLESSNGPITKTQRGPKKTLPKSKQKSMRR